MEPRPRPLPQHLVLIRTPHEASARSAPRGSSAAAVPAWLEKALSLMDAALERRWTVSALARQVAMSRPVFARRFRAALGTSPLRHLAMRRMQRAAQLLERPELSLAEVAARVGYASEFAFNRAFKRQFRIAPGSYRRALRGADAPRLRLAA
ncbi:MAG TPA: helix-turn-helix transcriptional regulator [Polyangiales bacterium]